jgi:hypothetical protein
MSTYLTKGRIREKMDAEEEFDEISSLLDCYSMKLYFKRRKHNWRLL